MYDNTDEHYTYVFVRMDIPLANQIVQVGHACFEAGNLYDTPDKSCFLILFGVKDEEALLDAVQKAKDNNIQIHAFYEPDFPVGFTAACTEPIQGVRRKAFEKYKLWR
jgi:hypothetical protein